jgi:inosine/xanthosine triphosphate pyrophosphatase family protein
VKQVLLGSSNTTRLERFRQLLAGVDIAVLSPIELGVELSLVESADTPEGNATMKARAYFEASGLPTFATDYSLFIDAFPPEKQPGVLVGRIRGHAGTAPDDELLDYYAGELQEIGGESEASWVAAVAVVLAPDRVFTRQLTERALFRSVRSPVLTPGEPLSSLQFVSKVGKYKSEMTVQERANAELEIDLGIVAFVREHLD